MPAGHDFDALLIGALYGELSAVEESRLQAHLAAHPSDQEIFRQLTATRAAIRASAVLAVVEPPQAISAVLLQEAARRVRGRTAEIRAAESGSSPSRWMRWLSSLMASPGLAAAAMAVLVVGVFGTLYLRNKHEVAEAVLAPSEPRAAAMAAGTAGSGAASSTQLGEPGAAVGLLAGGAAASSGEPAADPTALAFSSNESSPGAGAAVAVNQAGALATAPSKPATPAPSTTPADTRDSYSVSLDDAVRTKNEVARPKARAGGYVEATSAPNEIALKEYDDEKPRKDAARERLAVRDDDSKADQAVAGDEAELPAQRRAPAPAPPAPEAEEAAPEGRAASQPDDDLAVGNDRQQQAQARDEKAKKGAKVGDSAAPATAAGASNTASRGAGGASNAVSGAGKLSTALGARPAAPPLAPPPAIAAEPSVASESISVVDDRWARAEHVRLVRLVRANKCSEAARVARGIAERAPRYYQDNLAGSSDVRVCEAAIRDQLNLSERAKRKRAAPAPADEAKRK